MHFPLLDANADGVRIKDRIADLSRTAWETLKIFFREAVPRNDPIPGAVIAIQTFGDFLGFNPHCHILATDGCFYGIKGMFRVYTSLELKKLEAIFRYKVFPAKRGTSCQGEDIERDGCHAPDMASFRIQRLPSTSSGQRLRQAYFAQRR